MSSSEPGEPPPPTFERRLEELRLLLDVYKHHWDLFLKGFALYLAACSVIVGVSVSQTSDIFTRIFAGEALLVASVVAFFGIRASMGWLRDVAVKARALSADHKIEIISFDGPTGIVKVCRMITIIVGLTGAVYICHTILLANGISILPKLPMPQPSTQQR